ncbi:hypothetical protein FIBSPDRAFT_36371 [Athelia psychrophila]|uniref:Uncharacterized protein n=1 Tax=Athelia psychrophila TaxID=1759441 RepID=A0A166FTR6_9AGAM|nr:hypothetical protein FIBSPDRAFT_36371 [Fibularhizoctonia sp. CBS 109695]
MHRARIACCATHSHKRHRRVPTKSAPNRVSTPTRTRRTPSYPRPRCWARPPPPPPPKVKTSASRRRHTDPPDVVDTRPGKGQIYVTSRGQSVSANDGYLVRAAGDGMGADVIILDERPERSS